MAKVGVVLAGCGAQDGAEIHESVITMLALDRAGADMVLMAPNIDQLHVINHYTGSEMDESRNVLMESARIARGKIRDMAEVHASDVAKAVNLLLSANGITGQAFNCYDRYISEFDVAEIACRLTASNSVIAGGQTRPRHQIDTQKLRAIGMNFGGQQILEETIGALVQHDAADFNVTLLSCE